MHRQSIRFSNGLPDRSLRLPSQNLLAADLARGVLAPALSAGMFMQGGDEWSDDELDDVNDTLVVPMPTPQVLSGGGHSMCVRGLQSCLASTACRVALPARACSHHPHRPPCLTGWLALGLHRSFLAGLGTPQPRTARTAVQRTVREWHARATQSRASGVSAPGRVE